MDALIVSPFSRLFCVTPRCVATFAAQPPPPFVPRRFRRTHALLPFTRFTARAFAVSRFHFTLPLRAHARLSFTYAGFSPSFAVSCTRTLVVYIVALILPFAIRFTACAVCTPTPCLSFACLRWICAFDYVGYRSLRTALPHFPAAPALRRCSHLHFPLPHRVAHLPVFSRGLNTTFLISRYAFVTVACRFCLLLIVLPFCVVLRVAVVVLYTVCYAPHAHVTRCAVSLRYRCCTLRSVTRCLYARYRCFCSRTLRMHSLHTCACYMRSAVTLLPPRVSLPFAQIDRFAFSSLPAFAIVCHATRCVARTLRTRLICRCCVAFTRSTRCYAMLLYMPACTAAFVTRVAVRYIDLAADRLLLPFLRYRCYACVTCLFTAFTLPHFTAHFTLLHFVAVFFTRSCRCCGTSVVHLPHVALFVTVTRYDRCRRCHAVCVFTCRCCCVCYYTARCVACGDYTIATSHSMLCYVVTIHPFLLCYIVLMLILRCSQHLLPLLLPRFVTR